MPAKKGDVPNIIRLVLSLYLESNKQVCKLCLDTELSTRALTNGKHQELALTAFKC